MTSTPLLAEIQRADVQIKLMTYIKAALADSGADYDRVAYRLAYVLLDCTPPRHQPDWLFDLAGGDTDDVANYLKAHYPRPNITADEVTK